MVSRRSRLALLLLICLLSPCAELEARARNVRFGRISLQQGLSQSAVNCVFQDGRGFMWFGTEDGLNRYDGYDFTIYKHDREDPRSLSHNWVWTVYEDRNKSLWVGTDGGGLERWNGEDRGFVHFKNDPGDPTSLSGDRVRVVYEDSQGVLWIGTDTGLNRFDAATSTFARFNHNPSNPTSLSDDRIRAILEDRAGTLWIGTYGGGLDRLDRANGSFLHSRHRAQDPTSLGHDRVRALYEDVKGTLWVGTEGGGLGRLDRATGRFRRYVNAAADAASLSDDRVWAIRGDSEGVMWVGTEGGLNAWDPASESFAHYRNDPADAASLSDDRVLSVYEDRGGVLWVGTKVAGLSTWNRLTAPFAHFKQEPNTPTSLSSNVVTSFQEDRDGTLWVGTFGGGLNRLDRAKATFRHYQKNPGDPKSLGDDRVMSLHMDADGTLWVGTLSSGLYRLDASRSKFVGYRHDPKNPASLSSDGIMFIREDRAGVLWIGTYGGGLDRFDRASGSVIAYHNDPANPTSLGSDRVTAFCEDADGNLWIGTDGGGLNLFDRANGTFARYRHDPANPRSLSSDVVWSIHEDRSGTLWIGTQGGGINRWERADRRSHHGLFRGYAEKDGLPNDFVYASLEDRAGSLWISTNRGLAKFDPKTEVFRNYDSSHGLQGNEFNFGAAYQSPSGEMFFGGTNGFNAFRPDDVRDNAHVPPVRLTRFLKFNRPVKLDRPIWDTRELQLAYNDYVISFEFAALDYSAPQRNLYAYKLEGFDKDWIGLGNVHRVTYTNLGAAQYVLRIKGSNSDGTWNTEGVSLPIRVIPPPWQSSWAYGLYGLSMVGALFAYAQRQRQKREQEAEYTRKLEAEVRARTEELAERNRELEMASLTDSLTGLRNRRFVLDYIRKDVAAILREHEEIGHPAGDKGRPRDFVFMMVDLDEYKSINDRYGHNAGDQVLVQVTEILRRACRESETVVRWGGDEFLVAGRVGDPRSAHILAERIRRTVEEHPFQVGGDEPVHTSCSIGFACFPFLHSDPAALTWEQVLAVADRGLFAAKKTSRNAWVGILSNENTAGEGLFHAVLEGAASLIAAGGIEVVTSVPQTLRLDWGEQASRGDRASRDARVNGN